MKTAGSKNLSHLRSDSGMTLIDMAVFIMVIGLLTVPLMKQYDNFQILKAKGETDNNIASINKAMADFYYENNRYPCPSVITLPVTDVNYGREDCANTLQPGNIHIGGVPFVELKIPNQYSIDGWSDRIQYTVSTAVVASPFPATPFTTNITVNRFTPTPCNASTLNAPMTDVHFVLVSHGTRGVGAYTADGTLKQVCPAAGTTLDAENCNNDGTFFDDVCARSDQAGATYFDDVVYPDDTAPARIWVYSSAGGATPDPTDIVSIVQKIGINNPVPFNNPGDPNGVDVRGNVLAGDGVANPGRVISDTMCDESGNNCFTPTLIAGVPDARNNCDLSSRGAMRGLGNPATDNPDYQARAVCQNSYLPSTTRLCASGRYAIGFQGGRILCSP